jgi:hypothetical protein
MNIIFWSLEVFFFLLCLVCVRAIINPKSHAEWTLEKIKGELKFYGFEGSIKTTEKSVALIRNGHIIMLAVIILFMAMLNVFLR